MFTLIFASAIPLQKPVQSISPARPLQTLELAAFGMLLMGFKVMSNHLANILLYQFFSG